MLKGAYQKKQTNKKTRLVYFQSLETIIRNALWSHLLIQYLLKLLLVPH